MSHAVAFHKNWNNRYHSVIITSIIIRLAVRVGKMNQILRSDPLPEIGYAGKMELSYPLVVPARMCSLKPAH